MKRVLGVEFVPLLTANHLRFVFPENSIIFVSSRQKTHNSLLQNASNNGGTWTEFNVDYQKVYDKKKAIKDGSAAIWNYAENLLNESVEKGVLRKL